MAREPHVFINYRREDAHCVAKHLSSELCRRLGDERVFYDEHIEAGADWFARIKKEIGESTVFLALIGTNWLVVDPKTERPRIDDANDCVRRELETALDDRKITVIPVLIDDRKRILKEHLPETLRALPSFNWQKLRINDWEPDIEAILRVLEKSGFSLNEDRAWTDETDLASLMASLIETRDTIRQAGEDTRSADLLIKGYKKKIRSRKRVRHSGSELSKGQMLGGEFELVEVVGYGGFGTIWKAKVLGKKERFVAIKVLHNHLATEGSEARERFRRGASRMKKLQHDHIVTLQREVVEDEHGFWFAMDFVAGGNLEEAIKGNSLTRDDKFKILEDIAGALNYVWVTENLVHRDVKPANILLDSQKHAKLTDFDLVWARDTPSLTVPVWQVKFRAPEGFDQEQDTKESPEMDVYSLAATALYALSGGEFADPRDGDKFDQVLRKADLIGPAAGAVRRAVQYDPKKRFHSSLDFIRALRSPPPAESDEEKKIWFGITPNATHEQLVESYLALKALGRLPNRKAFFEAAGRPLEQVPDISFVQIPAGEFFMGSPETEAEHRSAEEPRHKVRVPRFEFAETMVTNAQYEPFFLGSPGGMEGDRKGDDRSDHPAVCANWWDAFIFCLWIGGRLPSEAEWEYACRAGEEGPFAFGSNITIHQVNYDGREPYGKQSPEERRSGTVPVRELKANKWGLYQMHGNVWEWCADTRQRNYTGAPDNELPWVVEGEPSRVARGGSWFNPAWQSRSAHRIGWFPHVPIPSLGFRPARNAMFTVGLTGTAGAGKTTVGGILAEERVPFVSDDQLSREAMVPGTEVHEQIVRAFGPSVVADDDTIDRKWLRRIFFDTEDRKKELEEIVHPAIELLRKIWLDEQRFKGRSFAVVEVPLLFECGLERLFDVIVTVDADPVARFKRMCSRGFSPEETQGIMDSQDDATTKTERAQFELRNDGTREKLGEAARRLLEDLREEARRQEFLVKAFDESERRE